VYLRDSQLRLRAKELLKDVTKADEYVEVVEAFVKKLDAIPGIRLDAETRVFDLPFWSLIIDPFSSRNGTAVVCFTNPGEVALMVENGDFPEDIAQKISGIKISEPHAVAYFYELIQQLRDELKGSIPEIDLAFIHKLEKKLKDDRDWHPHEVLVRRKDLDA